MGRGSKRKEAPLYIVRRVGGKETGLPPLGGERQRNDAPPLGKGRRKRKGA